MYVVGDDFLDARAVHELDSAMDAVDDRRYADAIVDASAAIDLSVSDGVRAKAHLVRASARFELGRFEQAASDATAAIEEGAGARPDIVAVSYAVRAQTRRELGRLDDAIADATTALGLLRNDDYGSAVAHLARGAAYYRTGADTQLTRRDLERGVHVAGRLPSFDPVPSLRRRVDRADALLQDLDRSPTTESRPAGGSERTRQATGTA